MYLGMNLPLLPDNFGNIQLSISVNNVDAQIMYINFRMNPADLSFTVGQPTGNQVRQDYTISTCCKDCVTLNDSATQACHTTSFISEQFVITFVYICVD
jgi:hypothetical protein